MSAAQLNATSAGKVSTQVFECDLTFQAVAMSLVHGRKFLINSRNICVIATEKVHPILAFPQCITLKLLWLID